MSVDVAPRVKPTVEIYPIAPNVPDWRSLTPREVTEYFRQYDLVPMRYREFRVQRSLRSRFLKRPHACALGAILFHEAQQGRRHLGDFAQRYPPDFRDGIVQGFDGHRVDVWSSAQMLRGHQLGRAVASWCGLK